MTHCDCLVIGSSGFIGKAIFQKMRENYPGVWGVCREDKQDPCEVVCDLLDQNQCLLLSNFTPRTIIFCAGYILHPSDLIGSNDIMQTHLALILNFLRAINLERLEALLYLGSSDEYGVDDGSQVWEHSVCRPMTSYGFAKHSAVQYLQFLNENFGLPVNIVRPFHVFGPRQTLNRFLPALISEAARGRQLEVKQPNRTIDYIYIEDFVEGIIAYLHASREVGSLLNLSGGNPMQLLDVCNIVWNEFHLPQKALDPLKVKSGCYPNLARMQALGVNFLGKSLNANISFTIEKYLSDER